MKKWEEGKLYKIRFRDHVIGKEGSVICEVCGWVLRETKEDLILTYWLVDSTDKKLQRDNIEPVTVVKSTIIRSRKI